MAKEQTVIYKKGFGLGTVLFIIFLVLKLTGQITWSWLWVTAPLWIPLVFVLGVLLVIVIIAGLLKLFN